MSRKGRKGEIPTSTAPTLPHTQAILAASATGTSIVEYMQLFVHLLSICQILCEQTHGLADRLCQEVAQGTQGRAQLILQLQTSPNKAQVTHPDKAISFPVRFRERSYGRLVVAPDHKQPACSAVPLAVAHLLAQICGWLLYTFELSAFLHGQSQRSNQRTYGPLTRREREILVLMCYGYDQKAIASELNITPATVNKHRQHIYEQLNVHCERDALIVAYEAGLFSPLEQKT